jgi:hypothetical protein
VVGHQAVRQQPHLKSTRRLPQEVRKRHVVNGFVEDLTLGVSSIQDVVDAAGDGNAGGSGHGG